MFINKYFIFLSLIFANYVLIASENNIDPAKLQNQMNAWREKYNQFRRSIEEDECYLNKLMKNQTAVEAPFRKRLIGEMEKAVSKKNVQIDVLGHALDSASLIILKLDAEQLIPEALFSDFSRAQDMCLEI